MQRTERIDYPQNATGRRCDYCRVKGLRGRLVRIGKVKHRVWMCWIHANQKQGVYYEF